MMKAFENFCARWMQKFFLSSNNQKKLDNKHIFIFWTAVGALTQLLVFCGDMLTPLGFAHGILYAPATFFGLFANRVISILLIGSLGMLGTGLGIFYSNGTLPNVGYEYILLNRLLGWGTIIASAVAAMILLRLRRQRRVSQVALEDTASLLQVTSTVGGLGGWRVKLPEMESYWSAEVFKILGRPHGTVPDIDTIIGWYDEKYQADVLDKFEKCVSEGHPFDTEIQVIHPNGTHHWVRLVGEAVWNDQGQIEAAQGAVQDIHKHKAVQKEIESSREEWQLLAESVPMIVWTTNSLGRMSYVNQFAAGYMGSNARQLIQEGWWQYVHPDDKPNAKAIWKTALMTVQPFLAEFRVLRHDGTWRWHLARAVRVDASKGAQWYGTAMDIQDFKEAQETGSQLANRLVETMESVADAIFVLDHDWIFTYMNRQCETVLERKREELLSRCVWDEFPQARGSKFQLEYERCVKEHATVRFDAEYAPLKKHFEVSAYPHQGGVIVYFRDVTTQKRLTEQLQQAQRIDALGKLTGGVAHDFNNLLTVILGNAEILAEQFGASTQEQALTQMISSAAQRGAEMTQRLLTFARKQSLEPQVLELNTLVKEMTPLLRRSLGQQIWVETIYCDGLWPTLVDPGQLEMALLNLAINARDAMPSGGRLLIETSNTVLDEDYAAQHMDLQAGPYVMLVVSDTGQGISKENLARVFEPFFTTKEQGKGTGLGLPTVYGFVKQSRGHVAIYSEINQGTTVKIYLPRCLENDRYTPASAMHEVHHDGQGRLVLLVEDDAQVRQISRRQLETLGYAVIEAENSQQALHQLVCEPDIALLFTDVVMPGGMSGRELAHQARTLRPDLPVLFASGYTGHAMVHHGGLGAGALLLPKPYLRSQLADKLVQAFKSAATSDLDSSLP